MQTARRQALKLLSSIPLLPLGGASAASLLMSACSGDSDASITGTPTAPVVSFDSASFSPMAAPGISDPAAMGTTSVASSLNVKLSDGTTQSFKLAYQPFFITGDLVPDGKGGKVLSGGYVDINNKPIIDSSVAGLERQFFSDCADGTTLFKLDSTTVPGIKGKAVFAVVQFEYTSNNQAGKSMYGMLPSPIAILTLDQDQATGKLTLVKYHNVDTSPAHMLWITCGASQSPWNTHLSSEEYEPDAFSASADTQFKAFSKNVFGDEAKANPYHYGHLPEVTVNPDGTGSIKKHYCLGRISHELIQVMPDNRTALMGDDASNSGLFIFVADKEKDLSSGSLYVAKVGSGFSIDPAASSGAALTWIKLGSATSAEIEKLANTLKPSDIMSVSYVDPISKNSAATGYTKIYANGSVQWIKINPGMEKAAAFLETHRYASFVGASMVFTKMEGTTVNTKDKIAYSALQNIQGSMVKGDKANNPNDSVALDKALKAGGIMAHTLTGGQKDLGGAAINSEWVPVQTRALIVGEDIVKDALGNTANPDKIANPDNLKFSEKLRTLFIGEDSGQHVNNFVWAYNIDTKVLSRLISMPAGAEATGLVVVDDLNGWTYIMSSFQHPGEWISTMDATAKLLVNPYINTNYKNKFACAVGYLTAETTSIKLSKV
ncbi:DUF839 domain-containing protein [Iodobacter ciconiae]|uniref:DUF839 domain-containing protein n=2 Tax=Iodobacter ciconiae TaxID=2496266 RepID=A0A3S8ZX70_9NEIS|nr:DUF839 domain-containing protein [Iodobacter ciconiae]